MSRFDYFLTVGIIISYVVVVGVCMVLGNI